LDGGSLFTTSICDRSDLLSEGTFYQIWLEFVVFGSSSHVYFEISDPFQFTTNTAPSNGSCFISPTLGIALATVFTVDCTDYVGLPILRYNYRWNNIYLKTNFTQESNDSLILPYGNQTIDAFIIDGYNFATCETIEIFVDFPFDEYTNVSDFTDYLLEVW